MRTELALDILKLVLLAALYLFFARVLWAVWSEVRTDRRVVASHRVNERAPTRAAPGAQAAKGAEGQARQRRTGRDPRTEGEAGHVVRPQRCRHARSRSAATPVAR